MKKLDLMKSWQFSKDNVTWEEVHLPHDAMILEEREPDGKNGKNTGYYPGGYYYYRKRFLVPEEWNGKRVVLEFEGIYRNAEVFLNEESLYLQHYGYTGFFIDLSEKLLYGKENTLLITVDNKGEPSSRWYTGSGIYRPVWIHVGEKDSLLPEEVSILTLSHDPAVIEIKSERDVSPFVTVKDKDGNAVYTGQGNTHTITVEDAHLWSSEDPYLYTCEFITDNDILTVPFGICHIRWNTEGLFLNGQETKLRGTCIHHDNGVLGAKEFDVSAQRRVKILKEAGFNAIRSAHNPISKALLRACDELGMYVMDEFTDMWYEHKTRYDYALYFEEDHEKDLTAMVRKDRNHPSVIMYSIGNEVTETYEEDGIAYAEEMTGLCHSLDLTRPVTCGINMALNTMHFAGIGVYQPTEDEAPKKPRRKNPKAMAILMQMAKERGMDLSQKKESDHQKATQESLGVSAEAGEKEEGKLVGSEKFNQMMVTMKEQQRQVVKQPIAKILSEDAYAKLDIAGYNYADGRYLLDKEEYPDRVSVGSETLPHRIAENWKLVKECPYLIGDFIWTEWDYIGEAGVGTFCYDSIGSKDKEYPALLAGCGIIDITGMMRPEVALSKAVFGLDKGPYIGVEPLTHAEEGHLISAWRYTDCVRSWSYEGYEDVKTTVRVYADAARVEGYLNGKLIANVPVHNCETSFETVYEPGELSVIAYDGNGNEVGRDVLRSAGSGKKITLSASTDTLLSNGQDLSYLDIAVTDEDGTVRCEKEYPLEIAVEGAGRLEGFGNADPYNTESYVTGHHYTYYGRAQAIIRSLYEKGEIRVTVKSGELSAETILTVK